MEELLKKKEELEKRIVDLQSEIEMGTILGDQDMIEQGQKNIEDINALISEIDQKIELENKKGSKKQALDEKYPEQYLYERIMTMGEEELREYSSGQISMNNDQKIAIDNELSELSKQSEELSAELASAVARTAEVKEIFKNTHDQGLLVEAKGLVEKQELLKQEIEKVEAAKEAKQQELSQIGPTEMDPESVRQGMVAQLEGKYKEADNSATYEYIQQKQAEGKSIEEITEDINKQTSNIDEDETCFGILAKNNETSMDSIRKLSTESYNKINELIEYYETAINNIKDNADLKSNCETLISSLKEVKGEIEPLKETIIRHDELKEKHFNRNITEEELQEANEIISVLMSKEKELSPKFINIATTKDLIDTMIVYDMEDKLDDEHKLDPANKEKDIEIVKANRENYLEWVEGMKSGKADDPSFQEIQQTHDNLYKDVKRISAQNKASIENILANGKSFESSERMIGDLSSIAAALPGQYTTEDIENYIVEQEFIKETKETALKDSKARKEELTRETQAVEISKLSEEEELKKMFEAPAVAITEEARTY